jgi:DNA-binding NtrC family response regulator
MERLLLAMPPGADTIEDLGLTRGEAPEGDRFQIDFSRGPVPWEAIERAAIEGAVRTAGGNVSEAARLLGLGRGALRYRMSRHKLDPGEDAAGPEGEAEERRAA